MPDSEPVATCPNCDAPLASRDSPWADHVYECTGECPVLTVDIRVMAGRDT